MPVAASRSHRGEPREVIAVGEERSGRTTSPQDLGRAVVPPHGRDRGAAGGTSRSTTWTAEAASGKEIAVIAQDTATGRSNVRTNTHHGPRAGRRAARVRAARPRARNTVIAEDRPG